MHYLQKYKGKSTRYSCPACETIHSFTLYLNGDTHEPIHRTVGICNRETKCGYHYTPKQYFADNPINQSSTMIINPASPRITHTPSPLGRAGVGFIPFSYVQQSASYKSNFVRFLCEFLTVEQIKSAGENYALGATKSKEVIFWQIDITGKVRTGKIMQYNAATGKRNKHESGAIDWVHNKLKKSGKLPEDFNLLQCFFGEHLLKIYPEKSIAIVESEKSAIIASCIFPDLIWLAAGNLNGLTIEKCQVLKERDVTLYPDLGAYEKWSLKATEIQKQYNCNIILSNLLEVEATDIDREKGLDIADYIIAELILLSKTTNTISPLTYENISEGRVRSIGVKDEVIPEILKSFKPNLQTMIDKNKALLLLMNGLKLEEVD